jgi:flotillin
MTSLGLLIGVGVVAGIVLLIVMTRLLYICQPNEVLIFSGARRVLATGRVVGYQIIKGGRRVRRPLIEAVDRMDLTNMPIELAVNGAYSKGGIPLNVHAAAMQEIATTWRRVGDNARQVFLMQKVDGLMRIVMSSAGDLKVDRLTVLGGIGGTGGNGDLAGKLIAMSEQLKAATGLDIVGAVRERVSAGHPTPAPVRVGT